MPALITNKNKPRVSMVAGKVNKIKSGFTRAFKKANTNANTRGTFKIDKFNAA